MQRIYISGQYISEGLPAVIAHVPRIDECLHFPVCVLFAPLLDVLDNARKIGEGEGKAPRACPKRVGSFGFSTDFLTRRAGTK
jgi:hypothetical protein